MNIQQLIEPDIDDAPRDEGRRRLSRRGLLSGGAALAAVWNSATARAQQANWSDVHWLASRLTFGPTQEDLTLAQQLGYQGYLEYHLNPYAIDDSAAQARLVRYPTLNMRPNELIRTNLGQIINELTDATVQRAIFSKRQLLERMVEFWTDHFNIDITLESAGPLKPVDDRDVIRAYALGTFPALLRASATSPSMLYYLDNASSSVGAPNENYSRELMELHTLGVDGGYTQEDVEEVARCFTGWTVWTASAGATAGTFRYNSGIHDNGQKVVLGHVIPAGGGINDGLLVLNILANHPSTAQFIATKLCTRFWGYNPPPDLIDAVAATYTATGGDIRSMLRTIFLGQDIGLGAPKYKRPFHLMVSALRVSAAAVTNVRSMATQLSQAGHSPFLWSPPDGYPDSIEHWVGLVLPRWNFAALLLNNNLGGLSVNIDTLLTGATTAAQIADRLNAVFLGGSMTAATRERLIKFMLPNNPTTQRKRDAVGLALSAPEFQWY